MDLGILIVESSHNMPSVTEFCSFFIIKKPIFYRLKKKEQLAENKEQLAENKEKLAIYNKIYRLKNIEELRTKEKIITCSEEIRKKHRYTINNIIWRIKKNQI